MDTITGQYPDLRAAAEARKRELVATLELRAATRNRWWHQFGRMPWYLRWLILLAALIVLSWVGRLAFAIYIVAFP